MKLLLILLCLFPNQVKATTDIQLDVHSTKVANIYYQVYGNDHPIYDELEFVLIHENGNVYSSKTNNSILFLKNVPLGQYELKIKDKPFTKQITVDKHYVKTQHLLKRIDIFHTHTTPNTNDTSHINFYISLLGITSFLILLIIYKQS